MSTIPYATLLTPTDTERCYESYLSQLAIQEVTWVSSVKSFNEGIRASQDGVSFISQAYLELSHAWNEIQLTVYEAQSRHAPIFALVETNCEPTLLAKAFDYGFDQVIKLDQPDHEANARIRSACRSSKETRVIAQNRGADSATGFYLESLFDSHLLAARGYAKRHKTYVHGIVLELKFAEQIRERVAPRDVQREILHFAKTLRSIIRSYDQIFRMDVNQFLILTNDIQPERIFETARRMTTQAMSYTNLSAIGIEIETGIYHFPVELDLGIEDVSLTPLPLSTSLASKKEAVRL